MANPKPEVIVILGPTASGKTQAGIELAKQHNGAVISADSRQVYSELNIGTAKPKEAWQDRPHDVNQADNIEGIEHFLLNIRSPKETYTSAEWKEDADDLIQKIISEQKKPIIVGGTMLYIDSLIYNYSMPAVKPDEVLRKKLDRLSTIRLQEKLTQKDPEAFKFIEKHHRQRMIRALEVIESTQQKFSELRQKKTSPYVFKIMGLFPGWDILEERITTRVTAMIADGLGEEIARLREKYGPGLPLLKTINYAQDGHALDMIRANLNYAKRQMNWWKKNKDIKWM